MQPKVEANYNYADLTKLPEKAVGKKFTEIKKTPAQVCTHTYTECMAFPKLYITLGSSRSLNTCFNISSLLSGL
jgi:hypothetical protein